jgi:hypothetical protein
VRVKSLQEVSEFVLLVGHYFESNGQKSLSKWYRRLCYSS